MRIIWVDETDSTNSHCLRIAGEEAGWDAGVVVAARSQTAGRGQRGNSWEAEKGKNLTFSVLWKPAGIEAAGQFCISEGVALAVCDLLEDYGVEAQVKWPNDIYVGDRKICGILIEHALMGREISRTIAGIGLNVNQKCFLSDAPNPVSMFQLLGTEYELKPMLSRLCELIERRIRGVEEGEGREAVHAEFRSRLWRGDGKGYPFRERASGREFTGEILEVEPGGILQVRDVERGEILKYAFKEVEFLL